MPQQGNALLRDLGLPEAAAGPLVLLLVLGAGWLVAEMFKPRPQQDAAAPGARVLVWCLIRLILAACMLGGVGLSLVFAWHFRGLCLAALIAVWWYRRRWPASWGSAFGTARWAEREDLEAATLLGESGLVLGRTIAGGNLSPLRRIAGLFALPLAQSEQAVRGFFRTASAAGELIRLSKYCHGSIVGPSGAGKNVSYLLPCLLDHLGGSMVVFDPKGENYRITSSYRRRRGQNVVRIDPFGICGPGADSFNVFDTLKPGPMLVDNARAAAASMIVRPPDGDKDPHWNNRSESCLTAIIAYVALKMEDPYCTMNSVRDIVCDKELFTEVGKQLKVMGGVLGQMGGSMLNLRGEPGNDGENREFTGILSVLERHTNFLSSELVAASLAKGSFNPETLLEAGTTVYLILPADQMEAQRGLLRLWLSSFLRLLLQQGMDKKGERLFLLDEAAQLGQLDELAQALQIGRGAGIRCMMFWQSLDQAKAAFKDRENLVLDNSDLRVFFGTNGYETASLISSMLGAATIVTESIDRGDSRSYQAGSGRDQDSVNISQSSNRSFAEKERSLLDPAEVLQLDPSLFIAFTPGVRPILGRRILYYADEAFAGKADSG